MSGAATHVLVLGGGVMQLPAVRLASGLGWRVSVAALDVTDDVRALSHRVLRVDLRDREAVEEAARALRAEEGLDGVFTAGTDFSTTVAWVAQRLGLPGIPYETALNATDKARMRTVLQRAGVPSPKFFTVASGGPRETPAERGEPPSEAPVGCGGASVAVGPVAVPPDLSFPLVVKPVDNMGARGVRRVDTPAELAQAVAEALRQSRTGEAIVEQYLEGPELSLDAVVHEGTVTVCGVADRHICFPPYFVEMGHTMPSSLDPGLLRHAEEVFVRGIHALGIREGAAKGDVKVTPQGPVIGEIAARLSGGYMSGWTYPLSSGVEVTEAALRIAVGQPPGRLEPRRAWVSAERAFLSIPGRVAALENLEEARRQRWVTDLFLRIAPGQDVDLPVDNMGKCGNVIAAAPSRRQAVEAAEGAVRRIFVRLEPANERTEAFLGGTLRGEFSAFSGAERDWHGLSWTEAERRVAELSALRKLREQIEALGEVEAGGGAELLERVLRRALARGSIQAGVYLVDTLEAAGAGARAWLRRWEAWT